MGHPVISPPRVSGFPTSLSISTEHSNYCDKYQNITSAVAVISLKETHLTLRTALLLLCCKIPSVSIEDAPKLGPQLPCSSGV